MLELDEMQSSNEKTMFFTNPKSKIKRILISVVRHGYRLYKQVII